MKENTSTNSISLDLYKIFCTVVSSGNMSQAAKRLYITQPAVSMSIRQLENYIGNPLLVRTPKGVYPTTEGEVLYQNLQQALNLIELAESNYLKMINLETGELKIGSSNSVISNFLLPYIDKYHTLYPDINLKISCKTSLELLKLLKSEAIDVCFINLPILSDELNSTVDKKTDVDFNTELNSDDFVITPCFEIHDILIGGTKFKHLQNSKFKIQDINQYPLLLLDKSNNARNYIDKYALDNSTKLTPTLELNSDDLLVAFTKINFGLAFVTQEFTKNLFNNDNIFEISIDPPINKRHIGMVQLKNSIKPHALQGFLDVVNI